MRQDYPLLGLAFFTQRTQLNHTKKETPPKIVRDLLFDVFLFLLQPAFITLPNRKPRSSREELSL